MFAVTTHDSQPLETVPAPQQQRASPAQPQLLRPTCTAAPALPSSTPLTPCTPQPLPTSPPCQHPPSTPPPFSHTDPPLTPRAPGVPAFSCSTVDSLAGEVPLSTRVQPAPVPVRTMTEAETAITDVSELLGVIFPVVHGPLRTPGGIAPFWRMRATSQIAPPLPSHRFRSPPCGTTPHSACPSQSAGLATHTVPPCSCGHRPGT